MQRDEDRVPEVHRRAARGAHRHRRWPGNLQSTYGTVNYAGKQFNVKQVSLDSKATGYKSVYEDAKAWDSLNVTTGPRGASQGGRGGSSPKGDEYGDSAVSVELLAGSTLAVTYKPGLVGVVDREMTYTPSVVTIDLPRDASSRMCGACPRQCLAFVDKGLPTQTHRAFQTTHFLRTRIKTAFAFGTDVSSFNFHETAVTIMIDETAVTQVPTSTTRRKPMKIAATCFVFSLSAACGTVHAQSSVTTYGLLDIGFGRYSGGGSRQTTLDSGQESPSRIGFRGTEDLGAGLSAVFTLEAGISPDTGMAGANGVLFNRGSYVGLQGGFGRVELGRVWSITDDAWSVYHFNNFAAFIFPEFGNLDRTYGNAIKYRTPQAAGWQGTALYSLGEGVNNSRSGSAKELGVAYQAGPAAVFAVYNETWGVTGTARNKSTLGSLAASYQLGDFTVRAAYLDSHPSVDSGLPRASVRLLGVDYAISPLFSVGADLQRRKVKAAGEGSLSTRVMVNYTLSKRTSLYANVARISNDDMDHQSFRGIVRTGESQTGMNIGVRHSF